MSGKEGDALQSLGGIFKADRAIARKEGTCDATVEALYTNILAALGKPKTSEVLDAVQALDRDGKNAITTMINGLRTSHINMLGHVARANTAGKFAEPILLKDPNFYENPVMDKLLTAAKVD